MHVLFWLENTFARHKHVPGLLNLVRTHFDLLYKCNIRLLQNSSGPFTSSVHWCGLVLCLHQKFVLIQYASTAAITSNFQ